MEMDKDEPEESFQLEGVKIKMKDLDEDFDAWVHTERVISITQCAPDSRMAKRMKMVDEVYPITRYTRGRVLLLSNASYQALRMLKDMFTQMNYIIKIETGRSAKEIRKIIEDEATNEDNKFVDSFIVIVYGTPDNFNCGYIPEVLGDQNAPILKGKPKLVYVIGDDNIVQQVKTVAQMCSDPDMFVVSTGFNGVMFYIYILNRFAHELSTQNIWEILVRNAKYHRFAAATHNTMTKQFYFFPGLTTSVFPDEIERLESADMALYKKMLDEGRVPTYNIRLMFVGLFGAGKTSTAQRIMGKSIDGITSTDGIDVQIGKCKVQIRNRQWETISDSTASISQLRNLYRADRKSTRNIPDIKSLESNNETQQKVPRQQDLREEYVTHETMENSEPLISIPEPRQRRTSSKRTWSDASEDDADDDNFSLSSSQSSVTAGFEILKIRSDSESSGVSADYEMLNIEQDDLSGISESSEGMRIARRVFESTDAAKKGIQYEEASVSLWDFAGQFVYYATHHLFFSPRAVYLLVVNLDDNLDKTLSDWFMDIRGKQSIDEKGCINFWLRSIYAYGRGRSSGVPPVILVGTHGDKLKGSAEEKKKSADAYFKKIRSMFVSTPLINNIRPVAFMLDNTKTDENLDQLKDYILTVSQTTPYWGEEIPAKWLELELAIDERQKGGRPFINFTELEQIVNSLASPFKDKDKLKMFLKAHHETGSFVYFGDSKKLQDVIVLQPQWIINAFRNLIGATEFSKKLGSLQSRWEEFNESGRITDDLAKRLWQDDTEFFQNSDLLLNFLEHLNIIAKPTVLNEDGTEIKKLDFYYVPCMLKEKAPDDTIPRHCTEKTVSTPVLCLSFKDNFMPPSVFFRVVALCMGKWPIAKNHKKLQMFCGCAVFDLQYGRGVDLHRLFVFSRQSKIGIRITRYTGNYTGMVDPNICNEVRRFITSAVKKEFARFDDLATSTAEMPFIYQIQCKETVEEDVMDEGLHRKDDLVQAIDTDFFCAEHSDKLDPHSLKPMEILHEWFNDDIPKNFRFEGYSGSVLGLRGKLCNCVDTWANKLHEEWKQTEVTENTLGKLSLAVGKNWKTLMQEQLDLRDVIVDQIEEDCAQDVRQQIFRCLMTWKYDCEMKRNVVATHGLLLDALRAARSKGVTIDFDEVQNVFDDVFAM